METKKWFGAVVLLALVVLTAGCASAKKVNQTATLHETQTPVSTEPETFGPPLSAQAGTPPVPNSESNSAAGQSASSTPAKLRPIVLVLGPGRARGYSYAGVFRALHEKKIPVAAVLGTEMGALMGALYGANGNLNQFEWGLLKLKDEIFLRKEGFFSRFSNDKPADGEKLESELRQIFEKKDLKDSKIPLRIALQSKETGMAFVLSEGNLVAAVRGAIATPGMFSPGTWQSEGQEIEVVAASSTRPFLVAEAKKLDLGPVVVVSVLSEAEAKAAAQELSQADLVIRPDFKGLGYHDFKKRNEIAFRGKTAVLEHLAEIQQVMGISESHPKENVSDAK